MNPTIEGLEAAVERQTIANVVNDLMAAHIQGREQAFWDAVALLAAHLPRPENRGDEPSYTASVSGATAADECARIAGLLNTRRFSACWNSSEAHDLVVSGGFGHAADFLAGVLWRAADAIRAATPSAAGQSLTSTSEDGASPQDGHLPRPVDKDRQVAWLLEWPASDNSPTRWWNPTTGWMIDANKACWFARKADAESYKAQSKMHGVIVSTEHVFLNTRPTPSGDGLVEALATGFHTTTSIGNPDPDKRRAYYQVEFTGGDAVHKLHRFEDAMRALRGVGR
jgi:hypothetical protein